MLKTLHLIFILISLSSFIGRVIISELKPAVLEIKIIKIAPHIINFILIVSGIALIFQGNWFTSEYSWIIAKIIALLAYIFLGIMTLKLKGQNKWLAFTGALLCVTYIGIVAVTKNALFFL